MRRSILKRIFRLVSLGLGVAFLTAVFWGSHFAMQMDSQGEMKNCPLMAHTQAFCSMTTAEHIAKWQELFTATVESNKFLSASLLLIAFGLIVFSPQFSLFHQLQFQAFRSKAGPPVHSSGYLLQALSQGILRKRE